MQTADTSKTNPLATEKLGKLMAKYAVPCVISLLIAALYNIVDQIFIANATMENAGFNGVSGNYANTIVYPLTVIALALAVMIGDGCCTFVSISLGKNEPGKARCAVGNATALSLAVGAVLTVLYLVFSDPLLLLFGGDPTGNPEVFAAAKEYFFWITLGILFYVFGQALNPVIRSDGNPRYAMIATVSGAVLNLILDPIAIYVLKWGMAGAAIATALGQVLTAVLSAAYLFRMKTVRLGKDSFRPDGKVVGKFLPLGLCSLLSQISLVAAMAAINNMIRVHGPAYIAEQLAAGDPPVVLDSLDTASKSVYLSIPGAVVGIVMKVFQIVISIVVGMAAGCIPIVGYNTGAGRRDRAKGVFMRLLFAEAVVGAVALIVVEVFPGALISIFGSANQPELYRTFALHAFRTYLCMVIFACINKACFIFLQSLGKPWTSTLLSMLREVVLGVGLALLFPLFWGLDGVLYSMPAADILTFLVSLVLIIRTCRELSAGNDRKDGVTASGDEA